MNENEREKIRYGRAVRTAATRLLPAMVEINNARISPSSMEAVASETVQQAVCLIDELDEAGFEWEVNDADTD